jgi:hypothetical protein
MQMNASGSSRGASGALPYPNLRARALQSIGLGGLTAGILDISDAIIVTLINGGAPTRMLQGIASGLLGRASYDGGLATAALGLAIHFFIATSAATVYFLASRQLTLLLRKPVICGVIFGLMWWALMYQIVLPITFGRPYTMPALPQLANQLGIHIFGVGLPIALIAARSARR